ncbi:MAG: methylamine utilization protein [Rhodospirillaceae bacterium]|nr:methylamine utilization protein [Rhodospirillaceae bacterium]
MTEACALPSVQEDGLGIPAMPAQAYAFSDADVPLPAHYTAANAQLGNVARADNTPADNPITNAGAALGRVLFYDKRLSANNTVACASCHKQEFGFSDPNRLSFGFQGGLTRRHSMSLANARYYNRGRFFWDERAATLEAQVLMPIQDATEMGLTLSQLVAKVSAADFYPALFQNAFGTPEVTSDRISKALAQFVRSLVSTHSKLDQAFTGGTLNLAALTPQEQQGLRLFGGIGANAGPPGPGNPPGPGGPANNGRTVGCNRCHTTSAVVSDNIHNNGLDANTTADQGAGAGRFKSPSLRNIAITAPYMHDGRFSTLEQVVEFYNSGVQAHPNLDNRLQNNGTPVRLNLNQAEKDALVAFMRTLTDTTMATEARLANPF